MLETAWESRWLPESLKKRLGKEKNLPVVMRLWETPVPIPNTMVKTQEADGTMLETAWESRWLPDLWGYSSVGRAPALQAGGQGFESLYLHSVSKEMECVP